MLDVELSLSPRYISEANVISAPFQYYHFFRRYRIRWYGSMIIERNSSLGSLVKFQKAKRNSYCLFDSNALTG